MKTLFFALLACLLTACFRPPQPIPFPGTPAHPAAITAAAPSPGPEAYASSDTVAAAAGSVPREERVEMPQSLPARVAAHPAAHAPAPQRTFGRREVKKMLRNALSGRYPEIGQQDTPPTERNGLALASLITGIVGLATFVVGTLVSGAVGGGLAGVVFLLALIGGILATVFGAVAKGQIRDGRGTAGDRSRATAGLIMGIVNMSIFALLILLAVAFIAAWSRGQ